MGEGLKRRFPAATRRSVRAATLTALVFVAAVTALLPAGAGAADGAGARIYWSNESGARSGSRTSTARGEPPCSGARVVARVGSRLILQPARSTGRTSSRERSGRQTWTGPAPPRPSSPTPAAVCGVALDRAAGKIYWANHSANSIRVANLDGTGVAATLFAEPPGSGPSGVVIDRAAGKIYWTNQGSDEVRIANLDGSGTASTLFGPAEAGDNPLGLAIDSAAGKVYWAALGSGRDQGREPRRLGSAFDAFRRRGEPRRGRARRGGRKALLGHLPRWRTDPRWKRGRFRVADNRGRG